MTTKKIFVGDHTYFYGRCNVGNSSTCNAVLILHSHPHSGGSSRDPVVSTLYRTFTRLSFSALAFDFEALSFTEEKDVASSYIVEAGKALEWLQRATDGQNCWIVGYSYGSWVAMQILMRRPEITNFLIVSPPVLSKDFSFCNPCPVPGCIITGSKDTISPSRNVEKMIANTRKLPNCNIDFFCIKDADHTFKMKLSELSKVSAQYISHHKARISNAGRKGGQQEVDFQDNDF